MVFRPEPLLRICPRIGLARCVVREKRILSRSSNGLILKKRGCPIADSPSFGLDIRLRLFAQQVVQHSPTTKDLEQHSRQTEAEIL